LKHSVEC